MLFQNQYYTYVMVPATRSGPFSTVAALPDSLLLVQARQLASHEQALQILVLDHLREIAVRGLHLRRGYGSLFDYVVRDLGYNEGCAWRRINAMRLCTETRGARELLRDGELSLTNAAQLQHTFERDERQSRRQAARARKAAGGGSGNGSPPEAPAGGAMVGAGEQHEARGLDAAARERLVKRAAGKSTREVKQMLAEATPELAAPNDRVRPLGGGRWELKAVVDDDCRRGLEQLLMLQSHVNPQMTLGTLVARLVRDGLDRYDPTRPPRRRRPAARASGPGKDAARGPAIGVAPGKTPAPKRRSHVERGAPIADAHGLCHGATSAPKRMAQVDRNAPATGARAIHDQAALPQRRRLQTRDPGVSVAEERCVDRRSTSPQKYKARIDHRKATAAVPGSHADAAGPQSLRLPAAHQGTADAKPDSVDRRATSAQKCLAKIERVAPAAAAGGPQNRVSGQRRRQPQPGCHHIAAIEAAAGTSDHTAGSSHSQSRTGDHSAAATSARKRDEQLERRRTPVTEQRASRDRTSLAAKERRAAKPGPRSRYIPVAVQREVWRRDRGCCSYVDGDSGRRCDSRYRLEIDHVLPFALGGGAELFNLRLRCKAHHRRRHAQGPLRHEFAD